MKLIPPHHSKEQSPQVIAEDETLLAKGIGRRQALQQLFGFGLGFTIAGLGLVHGDSSPNTNINGLTSTPDQVPKPDRQEIKSSHDPFYKTYSELRPPEQVPIPDNGDLLVWLEGGTVQFGIVQDNHPSLIYDSRIYSEVQKRTGHDAAAVMLMADDGNEVPLYVHVPDSIVAEIGNEHLTPGGLNEIANKIKILNTGSGGEFRQDQIYYVRALTAKFLAILYHDGLTLDEMQKITANVNMVKIKKGEGSYWELLSDNTSEIGLEQIDSLPSTLAFKAISKYPADQPILNSSLNALLPEAMVGLVSGPNSLRNPNAYKSGSCVDGNGKPLTTDDISNGARNLIALDATRLPGIITYLTIKTIRHEGPVDSATLKSWIAQKYGEYGFYYFNATPIVGCKS